MITTYDEFLILESIKINEGIKVPKVLSDTAKNAAVDIISNREEIVDNVKNKYKGKSFNEIYKETKKEISDSGVIQKGADYGINKGLDVVKSFIKTLSIKVGSVSTIGLLCAAILDYITGNNLEGIFNFVEISTAIALFISFTIYYIVRKKSNLKVFSKDK